MSFPMQPMKNVLMLRESSTATNATATGVLDCLGFDFASIDIYAGTNSAVTQTHTVLKLTEGDTTVYSNSTDITKFVGGGTGGFTLPNVATQTADVKSLKFNVDCRTRKRYLFAAITPSGTAAQVVTMVANLGRGEIVPVTASDCNALLLVNG